MTLKDLFTADQTAKTADTQAQAALAGANAAQAAAAAAAKQADADATTADAKLAANMTPNTVYDLSSGHYAALIGGQVVYGTVVDPSTVNVPDPTPTPAPSA
jgi:hypothetical protein